jgi:hypothetical protein
MSAIARPFGMGLMLVSMAIVGGTPFLWAGGCVFAIGAALVALCRS